MAIMPKANNARDSGITAVQVVLRRNTSKKPSRPQDIGEITVMSCIAGGMTNLGTIIPPNAPKMMLKTPPMVVACTVVFAKVAINNAKLMAAKLAALDMMIKPKNDDGQLSLSPPSRGTTYMPTAIMSTI